MKNLLVTAFLCVLSMLSIAQVPAYVPTNGLMAWWPFDGNGNDISTGGNNLSMVGSVSYTTDRNGVLNSCALFNSSNEYFTKSNVNLPSGNGSRTIAIWYNGTGTTYYSCLCNKICPFMYGDLVNGGCYKRFGFTTNTSLDYLLWMGKCNPRGDNISSHLNTWHHIVYTYDGTNNVLALYQDGLLVNSSVLSGTNATTLAELRIGSGLDDQNPVGNVAQFDGKIDDTGVWNRVLTPCEIQSLYFGGLSNFSVDAGLDQSICTGSSVTLNATGASTYSWNNGASNGVAFTPSITTTYTVTGTNAGGCVSTDQVVVTVNPLPTVGAGADQSICAGGTATLSGTGATAYTWTDGVTNGVSFAPASTTTYTVTGTNSSTGCTNTDQVIVTVNSSPMANAGFDFTKTCVQNPNGSAIGAASVAGVTYSWSPATGLTSSTVSNPTANPTATTTYTLTATNTVSGCTATDQVLVTVNTTVPVANAGSDFTKTCVQNPNGSAIGAASVAGVTYSWSPATGLTSSTVSNPTANPTATTTYTLTATNTASGCAATDQVLVTVNTTIPVSDAGLDFTKTCVQNPNGTAIGAASVAGVTYSWTPTTGLSSATVSNPTANPTATTTYTLTTTNTSSGCTATDQVEVTVNLTIPVANAGADQSICLGENAVLFVSGGSQYNWDNNVINGVAFSPLTSVSYTLTAIDNISGCSNTDQVLVTVNALPSVNAGVDQSVCAGSAITLSGIGANTYFWNNGVSNGISFTPATSGIYTLIGTNTSTGCSNTDHVQVTVNALPTVNAGADQSVCAGTSIILSAIGADTYTWDNGISNGISFIPVSTATYTVIGTDVFGCVNSDQVVVTVNALPSVNAGTDQSVCAGTAVSLSGTGATIYSWDNGISNGISFIPVSTATYTVSGTDVFGCVNSDQVVVTVNALPSVNAGTDQSVCAGTAVSLSGTGATIYSWDNGISNGISFTPAATATYSVSGTDANGCLNSDQVVVTVNALPEVNAGADQTICKGSVVTLSGSGASTYTWNNNVTDGVAFNPIATATYNVSGTDMNGCINTDEVVVAVNEATASTLTESALDSYTLNGQTYTQSGTYTQVITNAAGCDSTITLNLTLSFTGLDELSQGIRAYPNPTSDVLFVECPMSYEAKFTIVDAAGRFVLEGKLESELNTVDLHVLAPGTYTMKLDNQTVPIRIVKQ